MPDALQVTEVRFLPAPRSQREAGHLGWVTLVLGGAVKLSSLSLRRTADNRISLSFPTRRARTGVQHPIVAPLTSEVREAIESQVIAALRREGLL